MAFQIISSGGSGFFELVLFVVIVSLIAWSLKETSKKNQIKKANKYSLRQEFSRAVESYIGIKEWERAAEVIIKAPEGTQILLLRKLQSHLSRSMIKNMFLKIGDKYRNTHQANLSAVAYQLAEMPWRAAQAYIGVSNVKAAIDIINTSQVFANDRPRAIRNLAKFAYDTHHPLESARLLQSIGADDEATAVLVASGRDTSLLQENKPKNITHLPNEENKKIEKGEEKLYGPSAFVLLRNEIKLVQDTIKEGSIAKAQEILNKTRKIMETLPLSESNEVMTLKREYSKTSEAIKRLIDARNAFKQKRIEEAQLLYSELIDFAGELFNSEIYAEAGLTYEHDPQDPEMIQEYFLEASKRAKTVQAKKNYKARADNALKSIQSQLTSPEDSEFDTDLSTFVGRLVKVNTAEQCSVCKRPIGKSIEAVQCQQCRSMAHYPHIGEWLRIKGVCPVCKQKMILPERKKGSISI